MPCVIFFFFSVLQLELNSYLKLLARSVFAPLHLHFFRVHDINICCLSHSDICYNTLCLECTASQIVFASLLVHTAPLSCPTSLIASENLESNRLWFLLVFFLFSLVFLSNLQPSEKSMLAVLKLVNDGQFKELFSAVHANILIIHSHNNECITNNVVFIDQHIVSISREEIFLYFSPYIFEYSMKWMYLFLNFLLNAF